MNDVAVFNQIPEAGRCLGALCHQPPQSGVIADQVECRKVQVALQGHAMHGAQIAGMALDQGRWQPALLQ